MTNQITLKLIDKIESNKSSKFKFDTKLLTHNILNVILIKKTQKNTLKI
jgi:hypothetical protein